MSTIIVGGGVIGLSIARELHKSGVREISVVDRGRVGREASWAAAGMLAPNAETHKIDAFYRLCSDSILRYPDFSAQLLEETDIDIAYNCSGTLELAFDRNKAEDLERKYRQQRAAGIPAECLGPTELLNMEPNLSPDVVSGLFYPSDGHVDNRKLLSALETYARNNGITLIEDTEVLELLIQDRNVIGIQLQNGTLLSDSTIVTTGAWTSHIKSGGALSQLGVRPIRGQMLSIQGLAGVFKSVIYGAGAYLVPRANGRVLIGATVEDVAFDREIDQNAIEGLRRSAIKTIPALGKFEMVESWCGFRPFAPDGLPIIGNIEGLNNLVVATAHYRNGILLAPITAKIVASLIKGDSKSEYLDAFSPARFGCVTGSKLIQ